MRRHLQAHGFLQCRVSVLREMRNLDGGVIQGLESDLRNKCRALKNAGKNRYYSETEPERLQGPLPKFSPFYLSRPKRIKRRQELIQELRENGGLEGSIVGFAGNMKIWSNGGFLPEG